MFNSSIHIFLVSPAESLNVGSVARAMKNLGFFNLHLVTPVQYNRAKAAITACWATDVLETLTIHDSLESALGPMENVVGFTSRQGKNRTSNFMLGDWAEKFRQEPVVTGLLFGPEDTGLTHEHLEHCSAYIRIPASLEYPSYNLSQAVLLALYEIHSRTFTEQAPLPVRQPAQASDFYQLDRIVDNVLAESGFTRDGSPAPVPGLIRNLMRRINPDQREMGILLAMFSRIEKSLKRVRE